MDSFIRPKNRLNANAANYSPVDTLRFAYTTHTHIWNPSSASQALVELLVWALLPSLTSHSMNIEVNIQYLCEWWLTSSNRFVEIHNSTHGSFPLPVISFWKSILCMECTWNSYFFGHRIMGDFSIVIWLIASHLIWLRAEFLAKKIYCIFKMRFRKLLVWPKDNENFSFS